MGQLLIPAMIGAGVGAVGGAATGRNPFKTALLGAGLGAGGAGLLSAGGAAGSGGLFSGLQGVATTPVSFGTGGYASGIGGQIISNVAPTVAPTVATAAQTASQNFIPQHLVGNSTGMANYVPGGPYMPGGVSNFVENTPYMPGASGTVASAPNFTPVLGKSAGATGGGYNPSFFGRIDDTLGNPFSSLTGRDKLSLGLQGANFLNQPQQMIQPQVTPVTRGNPEMVSSPLFNVGPSVMPTQDNKIGLINLDSRIPLTDEEIL